MLSSTIQWNWECSNRYFFVKLLRGIGSVKFQFRKLYPHLNALSLVLAFAAFALAKSPWGF
jgi:hypothetical protein